MPSLSLRVDVDVRGGLLKAQLGPPSSDTFDEVLLPAEGTEHREITSIHPAVSFATGRTHEQWYAQLNPGAFFGYGAFGYGRLALNDSVFEEPHASAHTCVRLQVGDVLEVRRPGKAFHDERWTQVGWRAVVVERPTASSEFSAGPNLNQLVIPTGPALNESLGADELFELAGQLGLPPSMYALAATCRACRAAVQRATTFAAWVDEAQRQRSLWQLVGEGWPLSVLDAKLHAAPAASEAQLCEMLSLASMKRLSGFPFASHITKGWALVPAGSLLERASIDTIVHLCLRVPAAAQCLADTAAHKGLTDAGKIPTAAAQNVKIALSSFHASL